MASTMFCMMCGCVANIILDPIMIFGFGPVPAMGIEGAAWATGIGQTLTLAMYLLLARLNPLPVHVAARYARVTRGTARRLYSVGVPAALNLALPSLLISSLNIILSQYSQIYVVVLGVYYKLQTFLYLPANGIVQGMRPLVGYNYGAREYARVRRICLTALALAAGIMAFGTLLCQAMPEALISPFTQNAETVRAGAAALRVISLGFIVSTVSVIASGALEGLGMGAPSFVISLLRYAVITIPAAFILSRFLGAAGVWHAFWLAELCTAGAAYFIYRRRTEARR